MTASRLTVRQRLVLQLAADGLTQPEIGHRIGVSEKTVRIALRRAVRKLGARNRIHAAYLGIRTGEIT